MTLLQKTVIIDEHLMQVGVYLLGFLFISLVAIIVWLAKSVMDAMKVITAKQEDNIKNISILKNGIIDFKQNFEDIFEKLEELPRLSEKTALIENISKRIEKDIDNMALKSRDHSKRIGELERVLSVHKEWIRMKDKM